MIDAAHCPSFATEKRLGRPLPSIPHGRFSVAPRAMMLARTHAIRELTPS